MQFGTWADPSFQQH